QFVSAYGFYAHNHPERAGECAVQQKTLRDIIERFNGFRLDSTEYTCLKAVVLFKS
ncbi:hypothetical protein ACJMK2_038838, partial [Sinanodonta woodiana]